MKVRTINRVHLREGFASTSAREKGIINPDFVLEVEEVKGELHRGIDRWYKDNNGDFLWGGGVRIVETLKERSVATAPSILRNYNASVNFLPNEWVQKQGEGIKVCVIDSGISELHPDFANAIPPENIAYYLSDPVKVIFQTKLSNNTTDSNDTEGHGTHISGIIGARSTQIAGVIGVAPKCTLYSVKTYLNENTLADGINFALDNFKPDIINLSLLMTNEDIPLLQNAIKNALSQGVIIVAAAGENKPQDINYPAKLDSCIAVGTINEVFYGQMGSKKFSPRLDIIQPSIPYYSLRPDQGYTTLSGSSQATAYVSGIVALILSSVSINKNEHRGNEVLSIIRQNLSDYTALTFNTNRLYKNIY